MYDTLPHYGHGAKISLLADISLLEHGLKDCSTAGVGATRRKNFHRVSLGQRSDGIMYQRRNPYECLREASVPI